MRICDRCGDPAVDEVTLKQDDSHFDVCGGCRDDVLQALRPKEPEVTVEVNTERKRRGRPPKNLGQPK